MDKALGYRRTAIAARYQTLKGGVRRGCYDGVLCDCEYASGVVCKDLCAHVHEAVLSRTAGLVCYCS